MTHLLQKYAANDFADFAGLEIQGRVPIKQELLNELLAELLQQQTRQPAVAGTKELPPAFDPKRLLNFVKKAEVEANNGVLTVVFEVRR